MRFDCDQRDEERRNRFISDKNIGGGEKWCEKIENLF